jgi:hypothetical protein
MFDVRPDVSSPSFGPTPGPTRSRLSFGRLLLGFVCAVSLGSQVTCSGGRLTDPSEEEDDGSLASEQLTSLIIKPNNDVMLVDLNKEETKPFTVRGTMADGSSADFTQKVKWTIENPALGKFTRATFKSAISDKNKVDFTRVYAKLTTADGRMLAAVANLTIVWLRTTGNSQDFFFTLPYEIEPQKKPLTFTTEVQSLDVLFAVDTTGSMGAEINQLSRSLQTTVIPGVKMAAAKDAWFGVGAIDDWPNGSHGSPNCGGGPDDQVWVPLQELTADVMKAQLGVQQLMRGSSPRGCGADTPEGQMEALWHVATGDAVMGAGSNVAANHKGIGGMAFRDGALPVVTVITDASFHSKGDATPLNCGSSVAWNSTVMSLAHSRKETEDALNKICAKVVGVSATISTNEGCIGTKDLVSFANATGALVPPEAWDVPMRPANCPAGKCCTGHSGAPEEPDGKGLCPLVFKINGDGTGVGDSVTAGIAQLARFASFDVVTDVVGQTTSEKGDMLPAGKTTADFIKSIVPLDALPPPPPPVIPPPVMTADGFAKVVPGSLVRFNVEAHNKMQMETTWPQVFHATIRVRAGGCANLDARDVIILIPPVAPTPG